MGYPVSASHGLFTSAVEGFFDLVKDMKASHVRRRNINDTIKQLSALSDSELRDIGLSRGMIYDVAVSSFPKVNAEENDNLKGWV